MEEFKTALYQLVKTNTLLGGEIPPIASIFQQLEALSQIGYPFPSYDGSEATLFASPIWDHIERMHVTRQVYGVEQFAYRTPLVLDALGYDPYQFQTIKEFRILGLSFFPDAKPVFMPNSFKDAKLAMEVVRDLVKVTDTTLVCSLEALRKQPHFQLKSVFNPYFQYFRQRAKGICVSPDLICQAAEQQKPLLTHKNAQILAKKISEEGFSPLVGLNIMPINNGLADVVVTTLPPGYPRPDKDLVPVKEQESKPANPSGFEL